MEINRVRAWRSSGILGVKIPHGVVMLGSLKPGLAVVLLPSPVLYGIGVYICIARNRWSLVLKGH